jgi:CheY-like chemotaxis protein
MSGRGYILLIDDNRNDVELTRRALAKHDASHEVIVLRDGEEALDFFHGRGEHNSRPSAPPIVVLLDIKMPRLNGIELLRTVKNDPSLKFIPVVMLTSSREKPDVDECYRIGANAYVVKPFDFDQFVDTVKVIVRFWAGVNETVPMESRFLDNSPA